MIRPAPVQPRPEAFSIQWAQEHGLIPKTPPPSREELAAMIRWLIVAIDAPYGKDDAVDVQNEARALLARME